MTATNAPRGRFGIVALFAATVLTVSACGDDDTAEFDSAAQQAGETQADETQAEGDADTEASESPMRAEDTDDVAAGGDAGTGDEESGNEYIRGPEDAVESQAYDVPGHDLEVTVGLHTLRVEGDVMLLELSFTPEGDEGGRHGFNNFSQGRGVEPVLTDRENLKQYTVVGSGGDRWASDSSVTSTQVEPGQTVMFYAYYSAPQDDIDTVDVTVIDGFVMFDDVEIEQ